MYIVSLEPRDLIEMANASNEEKVGKLTRSGHNTSFTKKPRPPPGFVDRVFAELLGCPKNWKESGVISNN